MKNAVRFGRLIDVVSGLRIAAEGNLTDATLAAANVLKCLFGREYDIALGIAECTRKQCKLMIPSSIMTVENVLGGDAP